MSSRRLRDLGAKEQGLRFRVEGIGFRVTEGVIWSEGGREGGYLDASGGTGSLTHHYITDPTIGFRIERMGWRGDSPPGQRILPVLACHTRRQNKKLCEGKGSCAVCDRNIASGARFVAAV